MKSPIKRLLNKGIIQDLPLKAVTYTVENYSLNSIKAEFP